MPKEKAAAKLLFRFKNPHLIAVDVPGQGRKKIWYCWYTVVNDAAEPYTFIPEFELTAGNKTHADKVIPKAQEMIRLFEDPAERIDLKNSVTIAARPIPPSRDGANKNGVVGLAIWEDVDNDARTFTLEVKGLSNDNTIEKEGVRRKVLLIHFDRVDNELQQSGPAQWTYRVSKPTRE